MRFGVCTSVANARLLRDAGWDYIEGNIQELLAPEVAEGQWRGAAEAAASPVPIESGNLLVPGNLKITGPEASLPTQTGYMKIVVERAARVGMKTLVFGSGTPRRVPEGFDHETARQQILDFARMTADLAGPRGMTLVAEPLRRAECNILNTLAEALEYVRALQHPHFQCLLDSFHFWEENEPLASITAAMGHVRHVHLADRSSRLAPGQSGDEAGDEYLPLFRTLRAGNYDSRISVEARWNPDLATDATSVLYRIKKLWAQA